MIGRTLAAVLRTQTESCHGQAETELQTGISPKKARGKRLGLSRAAARGHARAGERTRPAGIATNPRGPEESGLKMMKHGSTLKAAARANGISQERLRRYVYENTQATRKNREWRIIDLRRFHLPIYSRGQIVEVWLSDAEATKAGEYLSAVGRFLPTGDASGLKPFVGDGVRDTAGNFHPFETRENVLYRLDTTGELSVPEIYKIQG
jgi:hypothetical protein